MLTMVPGRKRQVSVSPSTEISTRPSAWLIAIRKRSRECYSSIPEELREKILFFTSKPTGEGTGLGLSMSHETIVKQHGGSIDVETELGLFTEFKIVLPRTSQR